MPSNKQQYQQRLSLITETVDNIVKEKSKFKHFTEMCKVVADKVSLLELNLYVENPELFKSRPKSIAYQTLLTNKDYKIILENGYNQVTNKKVIESKSVNFEKDLEISNLKEKVSRLEAYIQNNSNHGKTSNKIDNNDVEHAYKLLYLLTETFKEFIEIDTEMSQIKNLVECPVSIIADGVTVKGFIEYLSKNKLKNS